MSSIEEWNREISVEIEWLEPRKAIEVVLPPLPQIAIHIIVATFTCLKHVHRLENGQLHVSAWLLSI